MIAILSTSFVPAPSFGGLQPGTCYTCVPASEKEKLVREILEIFDLPDDTCRAAKALGQYLRENELGFPDFDAEGNYFGMLVMVETSFSAVSDLSCREGGLYATLYNSFDEEPSGPGSGIVPPLEPSVDDGRSTPPEFQSAVFKCIGDYERCKYYYQIREARFDAEVGCGAAFLICTGQNLIPFVNE